MHRKSIVSNYFISPEYSVAGSRVFTPNASAEEVTLSDAPTQLSLQITSPKTSIRPSAVSSLRFKRGREASWHGRYHNGSAGENTMGFMEAVAASVSRRGDVVAHSSCESHQNFMSRAGNFVESTTHSDSSDGYRYAKLPRKELIMIAGGEDSGEKEDLASFRKDLRRLQERHEQLNKVVEETREELRRSWEENDRLKMRADQSVKELRLEVAQLSKHVQLLEGRSTSVERSLASLNGMESLVECVQGELPSLRKEIGRNTTSIAVLERLLEDMKHQPRVSQVAVNSVSASASGQVTSLGAPPPALLNDERATSHSSTTPFSFGGAKPNANLSGQLTSSPAASNSVAGSKPEPASASAPSFTGVSATAGSVDKPSNPFGVSAASATTAGGSAPAPASNGTPSFGSAVTTTAPGGNASSPFDSSRNAGVSATATASSASYTFGGASTPASSTNKPPNPFAATVSFSPADGKGATPALAGTFSFSATGASDTLSDKPPATPGAAPPVASPATSALPTNPFSPGSTTATAPTAGKPTTLFGGYATGDSSAATSAPAPGSAFSFGGIGTTAPASTVGFSFGGMPKVAETSTAGVNTTISPFSRAGSTAVTGATGTLGGFLFPSSSSATAAPLARGSEVKNDVFSNAKAVASSGASSVFGTGALMSAGVLSPPTPFGASAGVTNPFASSQRDGENASNPFGQGVQGLAAASTGTALPLLSQPPIGFSAPTVNANLGARRRTPKRF
ncbi:Nucleoporin [Trypanosoma equiperdum]|uniref:Nucleoporin n=1 Tax=Trypanosoma equiperdum TaxID=5694 RepID=A0A1G4IJY8_TRYEQ|nr:Nucleoporin [Trypanosoma equiperdum]